MSDEKTLRKLFLSIAQGYSAASHEGKPLFIKHFNIFDQEELDAQHEAHRAKLERQGIMSREDKLKELRAEGKWTDAHEKKLRDQKSFIENLKKTQKALVIPSQVEQVRVKIEDSKKIEAELLREKESLFGDTSEAFASRYISDVSIYNSFFAEPSLKKPFFSQEEFDHLERKEIYNLIKLYNDKFEDISLDGIKHLALSGLFMNYFNVNEDNPNELFGRKALDLTFYQLNLITYAKIFKSIFKNIPNIPDEMKDKPDELLEFAESGAKTKEKIEKMQKMAAKGKQSRATSIMGASKDDMEKMGYNSTQSLSPQEFLKQQGKSSFSLVQDGEFKV